MEYTPVPHAWVPIGDNGKLEMVDFGELLEFSDSEDFSDHDLDVFVGYDPELELPWISRCNANYAFARKVTRRPMTIDDIIAQLNANWLLLSTESATRIYNQVAEMVKADTIIHTCNGNNTVGWWVKKG